MGSSPSMVSMAALCLLRALFLALRDGVPSNGSLWKGGFISPCACYPGWKATEMRRRKFCSPPSLPAPGGRPRAPIQAGLLLAAGVRVPRDALLDAFSQVGPGGSFRSDIVKPRDRCVREYVSASGGCWLWWWFRGLARSYLFLLCPSEPLPPVSQGHAPVGGAGRAAAFPFVVCLEGVRGAATLDLSFFERGARSPRSTPPLPLPLSLRPLPLADILSLEGSLQHRRLG